MYISIAGVEDWQARMTLMNIITATYWKDKHDLTFTCRVIWHRLYFTKSAAEKGTMYQLCSVLNRTAVPSDPKITSGVQQMGPGCNRYRCIDDACTKLKIVHPHSHTSISYCILATP